MTILIFNTDIRGHHLEYFYNTYCEAIKHKEHKYIYAIPSEFHTLKNQYNWPPCENVIFDTDNDYSKCRSGNEYIRAWHISRLICKIIKRHKPDAVFLIILMQAMPFLPFLLPRNIKLHGIVYDLPRYETRIGQKLRDTLYLRILAASHSVGKVFILNDKSVADELNRKMHDDKFAFLSDPAQRIDMAQISNIRDELGAKVGDKIFLHFGGLGLRKGTLEIMKAIELLPQRTLDKSLFVFSGRVNNDIKNEFYRRLDTLKSKTRIVVYDGFCDSSFLYNLCYSCDYILMPYLQSYRSSGVVGYASFFSKPVLGPSDGLIGQLIMDYKLGWTVDKVNGATLAEKIIEMAENDDQHDLTEYAVTHTVDDFTKVIFDGINGEL
ncbi:MAG: glycosyltransferase [Bacteroidales bacterium]|nr:glycosyltransferase [Bacteroidales bacterium]